MLDLTVQASFKIAPPPVLYHYTKWPGAEGILTNQTIRATAHDCTNDEAELVSADAVIMEVANDLRADVGAAAHAALTLFLENYPTLRITKLMTVYLACFSIARDDPEQWRRYGDAGRGVCLGFRMLDEPPPNSPDRGSALIKVDYSEHSWRENLKRHFMEVCDVLRRFPATNANVALGLSALYRIAGFAATGANQETWAVEHEYRSVTILHKDARNPEERDANGRRFLPTVVRADGKRMALAEVIIGPDQDIDVARQRLTALLSNAGYSAGDMEYPEIKASELADWPERPRQTVTGL